MKNLTLVFCIFFSHPVFAGDKYLLDETLNLWRGPAPGKKINELVGLGITHVMIIKNQTTTEVDNEIEALKENKISYSHIPLPWKEADHKNTCRMVVQAIKEIEKRIKEKKSVYFHCTAGEDRTGIIAGLWRVRQGWTSERAWEEEMCQRDYANGNPRKPYQVSKSVHSLLTPIFWQLAEKISLSKRLDQKFCDEIDFSKNYDKEC